jgi:hypothetical protein
MNAKIIGNLNFVSGFVIGFGLMWLLPRNQYDKLAIFYYDYMEEDNG